MRKKFYQRDDFKALAIEWEIRLEQEGLPDIEKQVGNKVVLKQNSSNCYRQMEETRRTAKELYYQNLTHSLLTASFDNEVDRMVMELKANGAKIREICDALYLAGMSRYRRTVRLIIRRYEDRWGIRIWEPEQLTYRWKKKTPIP